MTEYGLFDWDNTLHSGYTIFSLASFFKDEGLITNSTTKFMNRELGLYKESLITHDELAVSVNSIFASALRDIPYKIYCSKIVEYCETHDVKKIFPFTRTALDYCRKQKIDIIVITGSPYEVILYYKEILSINEIYAFCLMRENGLINGNVGSNYGYDKHKVVSEIISQKRKLPILAFGDSMSDMPLFEYSRLKILVGERIAAMKQEQFLYLPTR